MDTLWLSSSHLCFRTALLTRKYAHPRTTSVTLWKGTPIIAGKRLSNRSVGPASQPARPFGNPWCLYYLPGHTRASCRGVCLSWAMCSAPVRLHAPVARTLAGGEQEAACEHFQCNLPLSSGGEVDGELRPALQRCWKSASALKARRYLVEPPLS